MVGAEPESQSGGLQSASTRTDVLTVMSVELQQGEST